MAYCGNCGTKLEEGAKFCPKCGTPNEMNQTSKDNSDRTSENRVVQNQTSTTPIQKRSNKKGCWTYGFIALLFFGLIGFIQDKCEGNKSTNTESVPKENRETKAVSEQKNDSEAERQAREQKEKENEKSNSLSAFVGDYTYSYYLENTNAKLYFKLSLKADGTFTFGPVNESTKGMMDVQKVVDGYDYPEGGKWEVKDTSVGKAAFLEFDCDWGEGSITPDKSVIQIKNMNGYNLKAPLIINN